MKKYVKSFAVASLALCLLVILCACSLTDRLFHKHNLTHVSATQATCERNGNVEYWLCSGCDKKFSDAGATTEVTDVSIPAAHKPNADDGDCTTAITCSVCGEVTTPANSAHSGGSATCEQKASCDVCGKEYGELTPHEGSLVWVKHMDSHYHVYSCCYTPASEPEGHTMRNGVCTVCGFDPTITAATVTASPGATQIEIAISITDNPGITGLTAKVQYSSDVLTLTAARSGEAFGSLTFTEPSSYGDGCRFLWDGLEIRDEDIKDGEFLILTFDVSASAPVGEYSILLNIVAYDNELNPLSLRVVGGKITIENN